MNFVLTPSLEYRTLVQITVTLWNRHDLSTLCSFDYDEEWKEIERQLQRKVPSLQLPDFLKIKVSGLIKPIGLRILAWIKRCKTFVRYGDTGRLDNEISKIHWTAYGTIDKYKTVKMLAENEDLDIAWRFRLSCIYCIEDYVHILWKKLGHKTFYKRPTWENLSRDERETEVDEMNLVAFWTYYIFWKYPEIDDNTDEHYNNTAVKSATSEVALSFFLQKANAEKRKSIMLEVSKLALIRYCNCQSLTGVVAYTDILCYLLSSMNRELQMNLFETNAYGVLNCLLVWPWQSFFPVMAEELCPFLSKENYYYLLIVIIDKIIEGFKDCNYHKLFEVLWQKSPLSYKGYVVSECTDESFFSRLLRINNEINFNLILKRTTVSEKEKITFIRKNVPASRNCTVKKKSDNLFVMQLSLLSRLLAVGDENNTKLILRHASPEEREKILFNMEGKEICWSLIKDERWDLLKFFIQECVSSQAEIVMFRNKFDAHVAQFHSPELCANKENEFNKFIQCFILAGLMEE